MRSLLFGRQGKGQCENMALAGRGQWEAGGVTGGQKQKRPEVPAGRAVCRCFSRCAIKFTSDSEGLATEDTIESQRIYGS